MPIQIKKGLVPLQDWELCGFPVSGVPGAPGSGVPNPGSFRPLLGGRGLPVVGFWSQGLDHLKVKVKVKACYNLR